MYKFKATQRFGARRASMCRTSTLQVALSLSCGTHILHAIECTQKISHGIFHPQQNHHGIHHPQENHHGILSSKAFLTMEYVIHKAVDALAWGSWKACGISKRTHRQFTGWVQCSTLAKKKNVTAEDFMRCSYTARSWDIVRYRVWLDIDSPGCIRASRARLASKSISHDIQWCTCTSWTSRL